MPTIDKSDKGSDDIQNDHSHNSRKYPYPFFFLYHTAEEAAYHTKLRKDSVGPLPESDLLRAWEIKKASNAASLT
jgi:hypothetical protein